MALTTLVEDPLVDTLVGAGALAFVAGFAILALLTDPPVWAYLLTLLLGLAFAAVWLAALTLAARRRRPEWDALMRGLGFRAAPGRGTRLLFVRLDAYERAEPDGATLTARHWPGAQGHVALRVRTPWGDVRERTTRSLDPVVVRAALDGLVAGTGGEAEAEPGDEDGPRWKRVAKGTLGVVALGGVILGWSSLDAGWSPRAQAAVLALPAAIAVGMLVARAAGLWRARRRGVKNA